jgi:hypothetical protein
MVSGAVHNGGGLDMNEGPARALTLLARYGLPAVVGLYYVAALQAIAYSPDGAYRGYLAAIDLRAGGPPILAGASTLAPLWVLLLAAADALGIDLLLGSKILSLVFCCFGLLGMYLFASTLIGDRITGLLATLVAAVDPWLLQAGPSGTSTGLALALSVGSLFFMVRRDFALGSFFAGLTAAVFWQGGVLMMLIAALITRSHGFSRASLRRVAGALAVFTSALVPWVIAALLQERSPVPEFLSGSEPLVIGAGRWAIFLSGAAAVVVAIVAPPLRADAAPFPVLSRVPYWGWVLWLLVCAWLWDVWFLVLAVPPFFALAFDALAFLSAARAGSATRYLAAILAITAVLVAAQQALYLGSTRPAMAASVDRGEEAALAAAWTRGFLRPTQSLEAEPRWQVSYFLGRSVDPIGRKGAGGADMVICADSARAGYREAYRPLPGPPPGGGPRLAVFVKQQDLPQ